MSSEDLRSLMPLVFVAATLCAVTLVAAIKSGHIRIFSLTLSGLVLALFSTGMVFSRPLTVPGTTPLMVMDNYALFYTDLILCAALAVSAISFDYLDRAAVRPETFYLLLLAATLGAMVLAVSTHFVSFFLGLETLSIPLYALISYPSTGARPLEAGIKYLILSAVSASFLAFGIALVYSGLGTMEFSGIAASLPDSRTDPLILAGLAMIVVGTGFKLAVVPFHMWAADVYEGAPVPTAAFIATVSKGAVLVLMVRLFADLDIPEEEPLFAMFGIIAVSSMFTGNLLALLQRNVKRLLGYSSIAHLGYLLVAFMTMGPLRVISVTFYLVQYFITTLAAFAVIALLSRSGRDAERIEDYYGLGFRRPWLSLAFGLTMLSYAGIPLTAGFMGKFLVITAAMGSSLRLLVFFLVVNSVIGLFYYLRVIAALYTTPSGENEIRTRSRSVLSALVITVLAVLLLWWGIFPSSLTEFIVTMTAGTAS